MFAPGNAQIEVFKKNLEIHRMITIWRWKQVWLQTNAMYDAFPPIPAKRFHACANQIAHIQCLLYDGFADEPGPTLFGVTSKQEKIT